MQISPNKPFICGVTGGILSGMSLSNGPNLMVIPGVVLLWAGEGSSLSGFCWGFSFIFVSHRWLMSLHPMTWLGFSESMSLFNTYLILLICCFAGGVLVAFWSLLNKYIFLFSKRKGLNMGIYPPALLLSSIWGLSEVLLSKSPIFFIGLGQSMLPDNIFLAGWLRILGSGGLASIQLMFGFFIFDSINSFIYKRKYKKKLIIGLSIFLMLNFIGSKLIYTSQSKGSISIASWQTNIPIREKFLQKNISALPFKIRDSLNQANGMSADLLIAPEGTFYSGIKLIEPTPIDLFAGGFRRDSGAKRSSLLVFEKGSEIPTDFIDKHRLVPLGERAPSDFFGFDIGLTAISDLRPGAPSRLLSWSGPDAAVAICYEVSDGNAIARAISEGGEWIAVIANLDPYPKSLQREFLMLAQSRSLENDRDLISIGNTGPSAHLKPSGEIIELVKPFDEGLGFANVELREGKSPYTKLGEIPLILIIILSSMFTFIL
tara:strand:+ start:317 stop:1780 length:1464 start_codon:yes stop_codon:yes gene_type:complete